MTPFRTIAARRPVEYRPEAPGNLDWRCPRRQTARPQRRHTNAARNVQTDAVNQTGVVQTHVDAGGRAWRVMWRAIYGVTRRISPMTRLLVALRIPTFHNEVAELPLVGRRSGRARPVIVGLIRHGDHWYVGHPNGPRPWLANLAAADSLVVTPPRSAPLRARAVPLGVGVVMWARRFLVLTRLVSKPLASSSLICRLTLASVCPRLSAICC